MPRGAAPPPRRPALKGQRPDHPSAQGKRGTSAALGYARPTAHQPCKGGTPRRPAVGGWFRCVRCGAFCVRCVTFSGRCARGNGFDMRTWGGSRGAPGVLGIALFAGEGAPTIWGRRHPPLVRVEGAFRHVPEEKGRTHPPFRVAHPAFRGSHFSRGNSPFSPPNGSSACMRLSEQGRGGQSKLRSAPLSMRERRAPVASSVGARGKQPGGKEPGGKGARASVGGGWCVVRGGR